MSDLVKRLRDSADAINGASRATLMRDAADRIEALEVEQANAESGDGERTTGSLRVKRLRQERDAALARLAKLEAVAEAARAFVLCDGPKREGELFAALYRALSALSSAPTPATAEGEADTGTKDCSIRWDDTARVWVARDNPSGTLSQGRTPSEAVDALQGALALLAKHAAAEVEARSRSEKPAVAQAAPEASRVRNEADGVPERPQLREDASVRATPAGLSDREKPAAAEADLCACGHRREEHYAYGNGWRVGCERICPRALTPANARASLDAMLEKARRETVERCAIVAERNAGMSARDLASRIRALATREGT